MNTYIKGKKAEREVEKILLNAGYVQAYKAPHVRFSKTHDMFNAWDILAIRDDLKRVFIQVKTSETHYSSTKKKLVDWVRMFGVPTEDYFILLYHDQDDYRLYDCSVGKEIVEDAGLYELMLRR